MDKRDHCGVLNQAIKPRDSKINPRFLKYPNLCASQETEHLHKKSIFGSEQKC